MKVPLTAAILALSTLAFAETPSPEFVIQVLEPTGGEIQRPKDWFYKEGHHDVVYMWTISLEDPSGSKPYTTGVRIQLVAKIKEFTGKTAKQFVLDIAAERQKAAVKVISTCEAQDIGPFTRICLETEEGPYHVRYSLFWGRNDADLAVITIAGTTKELWETYEPVFDRMSAFKLIDKKFLE